MGKRLLVLAASGVLLAACSSPLVRIHAPDISISQFSLVDVQLLEQRYHLQLRIQNPNPYSLPIAGMHYRLFLNGIEFAHGVSNQSVEIPAYGERLVEVDMVSTIGTLLDQIQRGQLIPEDGIRYRLTGEVDVRSRLTPVGFDYHGTIPLNTPLTP